MPINIRWTSISVVLGIALSVGLYFAFSSAINNPDGMPLFPALVVDKKPGEPKVKISPSINRLLKNKKISGYSKKKDEKRIAHAKELLGKRGYKRSNVKNSENENVSAFISQMTKEWLPKKYKKNSAKIAMAILKASAKYSFDPIFILAVIQNESGFDPEMRGGFTEIGLMQIKPDTAAWIAKKAKLEYHGEKSLLDPAQNILIGVTFMAQLRNQFAANGHHYISAYNMGAKKVRMILAADRQPKVYVNAVMKRYIAIYSAFSREESDLKKLTRKALNRVREVTRAVASG